MPDIVCLCSGGMDSVTLAHKLKEDGYTATLLTAYYGQRHDKEIKFAYKAGRRLGFSNAVANLEGIAHLLKGSALTDSAREVPEGHYADETMRATVVPNRNMILLSVAVGYAVSVGAWGVYAGMHAGDHPIYPDCRPEFAAAFADTAELATEGYAHPNFSVHTPFVNMTKAEIAILGAGLGVPWDETWSCYQGRMWHCGRCSTCVERREAFHLAGVSDPTQYHDDSFWRKAVQEYDAS